MDICPSCGKSVKRLIEYTGWCRLCTNLYENNSLAKKVERWLEEHADHIEHYLLQGKSLSQAINAIRSDTKPVCASCGASISRAPKNAVFCRSKPQCRRVARRYVYYYTRGGLSKSQALAKVLQEVGS